MARPFSDYEVRYRSLIDDTPRQMPPCVVCDAELADPLQRWMHCFVIGSTAVQVITCNTDACKEQAETATRRRL